MRFHPLRRTRPLAWLDGTRVTSRADWRCRRAVIRELAERTVYGQKPARPGSVTGSVSRTGITVNGSDQGRSASFSARVELPTGTGPFPAVVVYGGFGADTAAIKAAGAAAVTFDPYAVGREGTPRSNKQGAFYRLGARSGSVAALGGAEVYKALGAGRNISYWSDVQDGTHCASRAEWRGPLQESIATFLRGTGSAPGVFRISPKKPGNLAEWRTWQTPVLTDGG
ncbi:hypothetical protein OG946_32715 [Streptomyces sp. NBC_01808]|uniref:glucuronyl esterase domain-containing protein n=1 Tax=Streptomyces sp. NBC_01808 TaxID=2975947 RepID=UPI002DD7BC26|nr:hypothetical protein [Streptomyces sp. NBC_01808]WSA41718.1 hypothetical protein OG946_32715 [Streptomyces sp. NBC_01808]